MNIFLYSGHSGIKTAQTDIQAHLPQSIMYNIYSLVKQECAYA